MYMLQLNISPIFGAERKFAQVIAGVAEEPYEIGKVGFGR